MLASALALAPFSESRTHVLVAGSAKGSKQPPNAGATAFRCVATHFCAHLVTEPTYFVSALLAPVSHFTSSLLGSVMGGDWARTGAAMTHNPAATSMEKPNRVFMTSFPLVVWSRDNARSAIRVAAPRCASTNKMHDRPEGACTHERHACSTARRAGFRLPSERASCRC